MNDNEVEMIKFKVVRIVSRKQAYEIVRMQNQRCLYHCYFSQIYRQIFLILDIDIAFI